MAVVRICCFDVVVVAGGRKAENTNESDSNATASNFHCTISRIRCCQIYLFSFGWYDTRNVFVYARARALDEFRWRNDRANEFFRGIFRGVRLKWDHPCHLCTHRQALDYENSEQSWNLGAQCSWCRQLKHINIELSFVNWHKSRFNIVERRT